MTSPSARPRMIRFALATSCATALMLAGCSGQADGPASTAPAPPPAASTPTPTVIPTGTPTATPTPTPSAAPESPLPEGWETLTVDDWATFDVPAGWTAGRHPNYVEEANDRFLMDETGAIRIRVSKEQEAGAPGMCEPTAPWFRVLETTPLPHAYPGEELAHSTTIQQITVYDDDAQAERVQFEVVASIYEPDRVTEDCVPNFVVFPDAGGYFGVVLAAEPHEELRSSTAEEAEALAQTEEFATAMAVMRSFRATP